MIVMSTVGCCRRELFWRFRGYFALSPTEKEKVEKLNTGQRPELNLTLGDELYWLVRLLTIHPKPQVSSASTLIYIMGRLYRFWRSPRCPGRITPNVT